MHIYTYFYTYIHIYTHIYTFIHIYTHLYKHIYTFLHIHIYMHIYTHVYTYVHICTYIHIFIYRSEGGGRPERRIFFLRALEGARAPSWRPSVRPCVRVCVRPGPGGPKTNKMQGKPRFRNQKPEILFKCKENIGFGAKTGAQNNETLIFLYISQPKTRKYHGNARKT